MGGGTCDNLSRRAVIIVIIGFPCCGTHRIIIIIGFPCCGTHRIIIIIGFPRCGTHRVIIIIGQRTHRIIRTA